MVPGSSAGVVLSGWAGGGSAWRNPGRKKLAGEMLLLAVRPPHPATVANSSARAASRRIFQFNLTEPKYRLLYLMRNI